MDNNYTHEENIEKCEETNGSSGEYFEIKIPLHLFQYLSADNCDLQDLCRICLSLENEVMFPLWPTKDNHLLADMFKEVTAIPADEGDGLPSNICTSCQAQVVNCYDFKALCEKSNYTLKSILKGEFTAKDEVIEYDVSSQGPNQLMSKPDTQIDQDNLKKENVEDIQYLEDFGEIPNESCTLNSSTEDIKNDQQITEAVYVADTTSLLDEVASHVRISKRRRKSHTCSFCGKNFLKLKALRVHIKNSHKSSEQPYPCNQCKDAFNSEHDLKLHMALHTKGTTWKCNKCEKDFHTKSMLRRHIQRHMECKRYACETCGKLFIELYALRRHTRVHTGEIIEKKHACNLCEKRFRSMSQLLSHVVRHEGARPCACECGKSFPTPRLLASHARVHSDDKPHACRYCDKRFRHESTRNTHHRTHTGEKPYVCCTCGKTFIQNSNLTLHMRTHTGEKPYSCSLCCRKFSSSSTLKAHERSHTGERPYQCNICGKKFARMSLKCHMRLHTGERPFQCSVCPKSFVNASRLKEHAHVHTGEKLFECATCTQMFPTKSHLVKHLKTHQPQKKSKRMVVCNPEILVSNKIVISEKSSTIEGLKAETVRAEETACRIVILDSEQAPLEVHLSC